MAVLGSCAAAQPGCAGNMSLSPSLVRLPVPGDDLPEVRLQEERERRASASAPPPREVQSRSGQLRGQLARGDGFILFCEKSPSPVASDLSLPQKGDKSHHSSGMLSTGEAGKSVAQPLPCLKSPKEVTSRQGRGLWSSRARHGEWVSPGLWCEVRRDFPGGTSQGS